MSAVAGLLSSSNNTLTDYTQADLVGEYQEKILVRNSKGMNAGSTLFGLMSRLKAEPAENNVFNWFERNPVTRVFYVNVANGTSPVGGAAGVVVIGLTQGSGSTPGDTTDPAWQYVPNGTVLMNTNTQEQMLVTQDAASGDFTSGTGTVIHVLRATNATAGGTTTYTLSINDPIVIISLAKDEGAIPTRSTYEEPFILSNFVQTFNSSVFLTNAYKANKLRSDAAGPLQSQRIQAIERIAKDIEMAFLLGVKSMTAGANGYIYQTGGIKNAVDANVPQNALNGNGGSGVTLTAVQNWLSNFMTVGSDAKLALCGPTAYSVFSSFANEAANGFRIMNQETVFGMNITVVNTPFGELDLAFHPALKEISTFTSWMFVVDLAHVIQKTMEPLFLEPNIQLPGSDSYQEQFRAKLGLKLRFAEAFGYAYNLTQINAE
jgi:Family of unknown function (DUF5309)